MSTDPQFQAFATLMQLEREARHAQDLDAFRFTLVNRTCALLDYHQAALARFTESGARVEAVSNIAVLDRNAPFMQWLERALRVLARASDARQVHPVTAAALPEREAQEWPEWSAPNALWCPLIAPGGELLGVLWLARPAPWSETERILAERLADSYAHAWWALSGSRGGAQLWWKLRRFDRKTTVGLAAAVLVTALFPVRQSVLAPAEVVARDPVVVSAPIDGVIAAFAVRPNEAVKADHPLLSFEDAALRAQHEVAERALAVAEAEYLQASQGAFYDPASKARLAVLQAQIALRTAERDYAREQLDRSVVRAERDGIAVFTDPNDWIGKPVAIGERVMQLADPNDTELRIYLPVDDALTLEQGAEVVLFLNTAPLDPVPAALTHVSYEAEPAQGGILAYRANAAFSADAAPPRLGLQGTAKLYGSRVPFAYYVLRRPLSALRRWLGL